MRKKFDFRCVGLYTCLYLSKCALPFPIPYYLFSHSNQRKEDTLWKTDLFYYVLETSFYLGMTLYITKA